MDPDIPGPSSQPTLPTDDSDSDDVGASHKIDPVQVLVDDDSDDSDESAVSENDLALGAAAPVWSSTTDGMRPITFVRQPTLLVVPPGQRMPYDYFRLLLNNHFVKTIVEYSNAYAFVVLGKNDVTPNSRIAKWKDLTVKEFLKFVGLILHTGTISLNRLQDYWKTDSLFNLPVFRQVMTRDRFLNIMRCLYTSDPNDRETSSMDKIRFMVGHFNKMMNQVYYPEKDLLIDEAMVLWRGRLYFRQYVKGNRRNHGVKLYSLTESSGLILKFYVYGGANDSLVGGRGHIEKVVLHLLEEKLNNGHSVYMDKFYNGIPLALKLLASKTYCTGTIQLDRLFLPHAVKTAKLQKGETIARYGEGVMVGKWQNKCTVTYLSTQFDNEMVNFHTKRGTIVRKPLPIIDCNAKMSGVDKSDQLLSYYPCEKNSFQWYKKIMIHIIQMMLWNAYNLHNKYEDKMSFYDFRLAVIRGLLPPLNGPIESPAQKKLRLSAHKIKRNDERDFKNRVKRKNCRVCCKTQRNKKTPYFCSTCPDKPGLCLGECFDRYHD